MPNERQAAKYIRKDCVPTNAPTYASDASTFRVSLSTLAVVSSVLRKEEHFSSLHSVARAVGETMWLLWDKEMAKLA